MRGPRRFAAAAVFLAAASALAQSPGLPPPETGIASVYADELEGKVTASGRRYDASRLSAAHRNLPFGTRLRVSDPASGRTVRVTVTDRWGGGTGRVVNLSRRAAEELGIGPLGQLTVWIEVEKLGDGGVEQPEEEGLVREQLVPRLDAAPKDPGGRTLRCENEADILGLRDKWRDVHIRTCLARRPAAGGR
jgi:rare lipoprotein A (peptidoglycan hydrolase)